MVRIRAWGVVGVVFLLGSAISAADLFEIPVRINMGGTKTEDSLGRIWLGDGPGSGDPLNIRVDDSSGTNWIENWNVPPQTVSDPDSFLNLGYDLSHPGDSYIFSTIRWDNGADANEYRLELPIANGEYHVNLFFNEACCTGRHFKIEIQGEVVDDNVSYLDADLTNPAPPLGLLFKLGFTAEVEDQILRIALLPCTFDTCPEATDPNAILNAIEVIAAPTCDNLGMNFNCALDCESGQVTASWFSHAGADGYRLLRNGTPLTDLPENKFDYVDASPVVAGNVFPAYTLQALDGGATVAECRCQVYTYCCPKDMTCAGDPTSGEVSLAWTAPSPGLVTGYEVRRNGTLLQTLAATATSFEDTATRRVSTYEVTPLSSQSCQPMTCQVAIDSLPFDVPLRINSGAEATVDSHGDLWLGDGPGTGDPLNIRPNDPGGDNSIIGWVGGGVAADSLDNLGFDGAHPGDQYIFNSIRWDDAARAFNFDMEIPIPNGDYKVNMYFMEGCCTNRHFKIEIQGDIVHDDVDYTDYDPANPAIGRVGLLSFDGFTITEGLMKISLLPCPECPGSTDNNAIISALEILPSTLPLKVVRSFAKDSYKIGETVQVSLEAEKLVTNAPLLLKEVVPDGAVASSISDGGILVGNTIEWDNAEVFNKKSFTYQIAGSNDCGGDLTFAGSTWESGTDSGRVGGADVLRRAVDDTPLGTWTRTSINTTGDAASAVADHTLLQQGTGDGIKGTADAFSFVHTPESGDFELSAKIDCFVAPTTSGMMGLMVRDNLEPNSSFALFAISPAAPGEGTLRGLYRRESANNRSTSIINVSPRDVAGPIYLKMKRAGDTITFERSSDGVAYTVVGTKEVGSGNNLLTLGANFFVGLAATPQGAGTAQVVFSSVSGPVFTGGEPTVTFKRGDVDGNQLIDISDPVSLLGALFLGTGDPACLEAGDFDDNGAVDITDAVNNLGYQFLGTGAPAAPGPLVCGPDPAAGVHLECKTPCPQ